MMNESSNRRVGFRDNSTFWILTIESGKESKANCKKDSPPKDLYRGIVDIRRGPVGQVIPSTTHQSNSSLVQVQNGR
jgi:hypothetical protein